MIVPEYWAEARQQVRRNGRSITVRRFGWSDAGQSEAQAYAEQRALEAMDAILSGRKLPRRELRSNYGIDGVPIREQIVERHGDVIVTRNSYGALCLNTPDVLFADMDFETAPSGCVLPLMACVAALVAGFAGGTALWGWKSGLGAAVLMLLASNVVVLALKRLAFVLGGGAERRALARVESFAARHPDWHLRLYRTPAGLRVLAMHRTFSPQDEDAGRLFSALQADGLYSTMCKVQNCFRARLTAKPWRIGIDKRIRPPVAAWSREQALLPERLTWIAGYERKAMGFAACRFLKPFGDEARVDPKAARVRDLHDDMSRAGSTLPLA